MIQIRGPAAGDQQTGQAGQFGGGTPQFDLAGRIVSQDLHSLSFVHAEFRNSALFGSRRTPLTDTSGTVSSLLDKAAVLSDKWLTRDTESRSTSRSPARS
ncbi:hypothetical protein SK571_34655 [Lentzea sp. BCCO 10_0798]|uniref:Uncharacterized protein n=1 Tax=Lentzea kristufekii TaxID=3095430 RepID=A0ABU4U202_9PSEU|nr:hypothetical protein [Lentzea sp. BCCO 10_0798]